MTGNFDAIYHGLAAGKNKTLPQVYQSLLKDVTAFHQEAGGKLGAAVDRFERASGRVFDPKVEAQLVARLKGWEGSIIRSVNRGAEFDQLASTSRQVLDGVWEKVFASVKKRAYLQSLQEAKISPRRFKELAALPSRRRPEHIRKVLARQGVIQRTLKDMLADSGISPLIQKNRDYFPEVLSRKKLGLLEAEVFQKTAPLPEPAFGKAMYSAAGSVSTKHALVRKGRMIPDPEGLALLKEDIIDPSLITRLKSRLDGGKVLPYTLSFNDAMSSYLRSTSRAWGWTVQGHGRRILKAAESLESSPLPHNQIRAAMLRHTYIPVAMGRQTHPQYMASTIWEDMKYDLHQKLQGGLGKLLPSDIKSWMSRRLIEDRGSLNFRGIQSKLTSHLTVGALGLNATSSVLNLMQSLLTTIPIIGLTNTLKGMSRTFSRSLKYFKLRGGGITHGEAMSRTFPEFIREGLAVSPYVEESLSAETWLNRSWTDSSFPHRPRSVYNRVKSAMMLMFQGTEAFNRLTAFEGTLAKGLAEGLKISEASSIARQAVETTQFLSGPAGRPYALMKAGPLLGQFGQFTMRYLNYLLGPATEIGAGAQRIGNRNPGTLGRALLTSGLAYEGGQELGLDLSPGLLPGALPDQPTLFVPPVVSLPYQALFGQEGAFKRQLPILLPGGVSAARAAAPFSPSLARFLGRRYADYEHTTPEGLIPLYHSSGQFIGNVTPTQLYLDAFGLVPGGSPDIRREAELNHYLATQTKEIREYHSAFKEALFADNDVQKAIGIQDEYQQRFKLGKIQVRPQDVRAFEIRRMVPRLEQALDRLPAEAREDYKKLVLTTLMGEAQHLLGIDPELLLSRKTILERRPYLQDLSASIPGELEPLRRP